jgi:hypothetical protein
MAVKLFVKLQVPTIELKVSAKDAAGIKDSILVGFKRYEISDAQKRLNILQDLLTSAQADNSLDSQALDVFIKNEVIYIKQAKLELEEDGKTRELVIQDTRTTKPIEELWANNEEALDVLTTAYLASSPYRLSLILSAQKALFNSDYSEAEVKN